MIKVNTDSATFGNPGLAGSIGIFRTSHGFVKGCFAIPIGIGFAFEAELVATIHATLFHWGERLACSLVGNRFILFGCGLTKSIFSYSLALASSLDSLFGVYF